MHTRLNILLICFLFGTINSAIGQKNFTLHEKTALGYELVYQYRLKEADSLLADNKNKHPKHYLNHLLAAHVDWWRMMSGERNPIIDKHFNAEIDSGMTLLGKIGIDKMSNEQLFHYIILYGFKSRIYFRDNAWKKAIISIKESISIIEQLLGQESKFDKFYFVTGVYHFYVGNGREHNPLAKAALSGFPPSDKMKGVEYLYKLINSSDVPIRTESRYFLIYMSTGELKNPKEGQRLAEMLVKEFPANPMFHYLVFRSLLKQDKTEDARKELGHLEYSLTSNKQVKPEYLKYWKEKAQVELKKYYEGKY